MNFNTPLQPLCVLAFSGGLDTSFCACFLKEKGYSIHTAFVNTGGFSAEELKQVEASAYELGATHHITLDATDSYYKQGIRYLIYGNVLRNSNYPLSVSSERYFQAKAIAEYASSIKAEAIAHGSTGAGNDQVRFDLVFQLFAPGLTLITPIRDLGLSRDDEIDFLSSRGFVKDWPKSKYSINQGLWGTSVGGAETLTSRNPLPEEAWPCVATKKNPESLSITFTRGEISAVNNQELSPTDCIRKIQALAQPFAIGRDIHVGDTIIGIKGRVGFEAAAAAIIIETHRLLEKHTLSKWQLQLKQQLSDWYGMLFHEGLYSDPAMRDIEAFLTSSQTHVSGTVFLTLHPYRFTLNGIESPFDLMQSSYATYGEVNRKWDANDAKGFIKLYGNAQFIYQQVKEANNEY